MLKTNRERIAKAHQKAETFLEGNQNITYTIHSCPNCSERFGFVRGVFGSHATVEELKALRENPQFGAACGLYEYLEALPRQQPSEPQHKIFTPAPGYERFSDELGGEILRFEKATTKPANSKGPSGVKVASHRQIKEMESTGTNGETVELLRKTRDWKNGRGPKPAQRSFLEVSGDQYVGEPIVFDHELRALFRCRKCSEDAALVIF